MESFSMEGFREKKSFKNKTKTTTKTRKDTVSTCFTAQGVRLHALKTNSRPSFLISVFSQLQSCTLRTAFTTTKCLQTEVKNKVKKTRH